MASEKLNNLLELFNAHQHALRMLHYDIKEALESETDGKLSLCSFTTPEVHIYCGCGEHFDVVKELADEGSVAQNYTYSDGTARYDFTVNGISCLSIGPAEEE